MLRFCLSDKSTKIAICVIYNRHKRYCHKMRFKCKEYTKMRLRPGPIGELVALPQTFGWIWSRNRNAWKKLRKKRKKEKKRRIMEKTQTSP